MPFDPSLPQENTLADAAQMRSQFNGLKALIDANLTINTAQVDAVTTTPAGTPANVVATVNGGTLHLSFDLPQGIDGPPGPPLTNAVVDMVNTLPPGLNADVTVTSDGTSLHFTFSIPRGTDGAPGAQGLPGEVSLNDLNNGLLTTLNQTSNISNAVGTLDNAYTASETEELRLKLNELINALRR